jgi:hypothetical protein
VNVWVNRMVGDARPDSKGRYAAAVDHPITFTGLFTGQALARHAYCPDAPLRPAGLLGPVTVTRGESCSRQRLNAGHASCAQSTREFSVSAPATSVSTQ